MNKCWSEKDELFIINCVHMCTMSYLCKRFNKTPSAIYNKLNKLRKQTGKKLKPLPNVNYNLRRQATRMRNAGYGYSRIAYHLGKSKSTVWSWFN